MDRAYWRTVSLVTLWQVSASICYYTVFAATPFFRDEFGLSRFRVGIVVTTLTLGYAIFLLPVGAITDRFGERRTLSLGLVGLAAGMVLVAGAPTYALLLAAVFLLGSVYSTAMPGTNKAVYDSVAPGRQNTAMGIKQVGVTGGSGISALLVTGLAGYFFWEIGFLIAAAVGVVVAGVFYLFYRGEGGGTSSRPDLRGLASNRPYVLLVVSGLFLGAALFTTTGYTVLYVEESIGASVAFSGVVLAIVQLFGSGGRLLGGWLSDHLPGDPQTRIGGILFVQTVASAVLFLVVARTSTPSNAGIAFAALGFFVLGFTGVYYSCMATLVPADQMGSATAGCQVALTSGALFAPPAFGYLADTFDYRASWTLLSGVCVVAAVLVVTVIRSDPPVGETAMAE
ncbi:MULTISPECIES: MFS transporter [Halorubrum]|uniref:MFS transporter n=1 Tax=Halorubrum persicum TaxID=1383844 RepID=A0A2G1WGG0_9EURY|nr:MFS transporter [Halorubrum persicum]PHQ38035.1 MFS transporter [Halorubrum persicum]